MPMNLFSGLGFSICSLLFVILITIIYISKKKFDSDYGYIYKLMIGVTYIAIIIDVILILTLYKIDNSYINEILNRVYLFMCFLWVTCLFVYIRVFENRYKEKRIKKIKSFLVIISMSVLLFIISLFLPLSSSYNYDIGYYRLYGPALTLYHIYSVIIILVLINSLLHNRCMIERAQRIPLYVLSISYIFIIIFIYLVDKVNIYSFVFAVTVISLHFTIESKESKLIEELEEKKEKAEIVSKAKTEFLSNISHEIRTPLNTILGFSKSILEEENYDRNVIIDDIKNINEASKNLLDLINNILEIARIESNKEKKEEKEYELKKVLLELNSNISPKINKDVLKFNISVNPSMPSVFYGDYYKIYKILDKFIINAIKYTSYGKIDLNVDGSMNDNLYEIIFTISNTGHAMKIDDFNITFNDFVNLDNVSKDAIDNEQLGLIIAKSLLDILGGEIEFINKPGEGTKYIVKLKQKIVETKNIGDINFIDSKENNEINFIDLSGKKALIVDDNKLNIKLAEKLLLKYNFNVDTVFSGNDCIKKLEMNKYDIIFLDHMMPEMDGIATLELIIKKGLKNAPIIALTANSYDGLEELYTKKGFDDYLSKPISIKNLDSLIKKYFK